MKYLLAGDIGGTKTLLRLVKAETPHQLEFQHSYPSQTYPDLVPIVQEFFGAAQIHLGSEIQVVSACFGIAGPVKDRTCDLTNLNWQLDVDRLAQELQIPLIELINDFAAIGYGIPQLPTSDLYTLQTGKIQPQAPIAIVGAGTGLGEGFLIPIGKDYQVFPTEGGHTDFAARSSREFEFMRYMCQTLQLDRLSYDRVISGPGIVAIYQFLRESSKFSENAVIADVVKLWEGQTEKSADPAALISAAAIAKTDELSQLTMEMFISAYGAEAGNLALKLLPFGGLYLAGGIAAKNIPLLTDGIFVTAFNDKGRMSELLGTIPIYVILNSQVGLIGAIAKAATMTA